MAQGDAAARLRRIAAAEAETAGSLPVFLRERWLAIGLFVGIAGCLMIAVQGLNPLIALALERRFHAGMRDIGHALGIVTLITSIGCLSIAGFLDRVLRARLGLAAQPIIMGGGALLAIPCVALLPMAAAIHHALVLVAVGGRLLTPIATVAVPALVVSVACAAVGAAALAGGGCAPPPFGFTSASTSSTHRPTRRA